LLNLSQLGIGAFIYRVVIGNTVRGIVGLSLMLWMLVFALAMSLKDFSEELCTLNTLGDLHTDLLSI
jgi:hypothetical protein